MIQSNRPEPSQIIYAEVVVRSITGNSLLSSSLIIDSENISQFYAPSDRLQAVAKELQKAGFDVLTIGKISITIAGNQEVFERAFQTNLETVERPVIKELGQISIGTFINAIDGKPFGEIDVSHTRWNQILDGVAISEPVYYFQSRLPSPIPPSVPNQYLSVPDGVAQGLNANLAHQQGVTGKGVHVVMVDSGWYPHPFFRERNYNVQVRLASGSCDPTLDITGHGTGESANLLAIAPDITLTVVKADIALGGKSRNVNSIGALREAIALKPDIISCSWGSDERKCRISPYNRVLAAVVANAIRQGIIVVFSSGNGQYGFPAQHPEVIAAGGAYLHLDSTLRGKIEASNYASSFISPIYPDRRVPDVCGLVGNLPYGSYIMLPVPPNSIVDQQLAIRNDGTEAIDGWAAFSGTSAAAPQLAGICALMKQVNPNLSPAQAKQILQQTARDVVEGFSNPASSSASARAGPDLATGYGLVDAYAAILAIKALTDSPDSHCCDRCASSTQNLSTTSTNSSTQKASKPMASEFPKLKKNLDLVLWEIEKTLQKKLASLGIDEEIELNIGAENFVSRSVITKVAYSFRAILYGDKDDKNKEGNEGCIDANGEANLSKIGDKDDKNKEGNEGCIDANGEVNLSKITEVHISAAQALFQLGKDQETAINVITKALMIPASSDKQAIRKAASLALSECSSQIRDLDKNSGGTASNFFSAMEITIGGKKQTCDVYTVTTEDGVKEIKASCPDGKTYIL